MVYYLFQTVLALGFALAHIDFKKATSTSRLVHVEEDHFEKNIHKRDVGNKPPSSSQSADLEDFGEPAGPPNDRPGPRPINGTSRNNTKHGTKNRIGSRNQRPDMGGQISRRCRSSSGSSRREGPPPGGPRRQPTYRQARSNRTRSGNRRFNVSESCTDGGGQEGLDSESSTHPRGPPPPRIGNPPTRDENTT